MGRQSEMVEAIAEVLWEDELLEESQSMEFFPVLRSTVGYVVSSDDDDCLILVTDLYQKDQNKINTPMSIPWEAIVDWWEFEVH